MAFAGKQSILIGRESYNEAPICFPQTLSSRLCLLVGLRLPVSKSIGGEILYMPETLNVCNTCQQPVEANARRCPICTATLRPKTRIHQTMNVVFLMIVGVVALGILSQVVDLLAKLKNAQ